MEELGNEVRRSQLGIKREQDLSFSPFFFVLSFFICNFAARLIRIIKMELQNCINTIRENSSKIVCDFGIRTLRIFGSVSRNKIGFVSPERRYEAPTVARPPQM